MDACKKYPIFFKLGNELRNCLQKLHTKTSKMCREVNSILHDKSVNETVPQYWARKPDIFCVSPHVALP